MPRPWLLPRCVGAAQHSTAGVHCAAQRPPPGPSAPNGPLALPSLHWIVLGNAAMRAGSGRDGRAGSWPRVGAVQGAAVCCCNSHPPHPRNPHPTHPTPPAQAISTACGQCPGALSTALAQAQATAQSQGGNADAIASAVADASAGKLWGRAGEQQRKLHGLQLVCHAAAAERGGDLQGERQHDEWCACKPQPAHAFRHPYVCQDAPPTTLPNLPTLPPDLPSPPRRRQHPALPVHPRRPVPGRCEGGEHRHLLWRFRPGFLHRHRHRRAQVSARKCTRLAVGLRGACPSPGDCPQTVLKRWPTPTAAGTANRARSDAPWRAARQSAPFHSAQFFCAPPDLSTQSNRAHTCCFEQLVGFRYFLISSCLPSSVCASDTLRARTRQLEPDTSAQRNAPSKRLPNFVRRHGAETERWDRGDRVLLEKPAGRRREKVYARNLPSSFRGSAAQAVQSTTREEGHLGSSEPNPLSRERESEGTPQRSQLVVCPCVGVQAWSFKQNLLRTSAAPRAASATSWLQKAPPRRAWVRLDSRQPRADPRAGS